jgi:hypothetical protein
LLGYDLEGVTIKDGDLKERVVDPGKGPLDGMKVWGVLSSVWDTSQFENLIGLIDSTGGV